MTTSLPNARRLAIASVVAGLALGAPAFAGSESVNCVQFVKFASGVVLSGDAYEWWDSADGRYGRGFQPKPGSVMVFEQSHRLPHGHVALVRRQLDSRTVLIDHANWSRFQGRKGRIEQGVRVVDVSPANDWSQVRVWYQEAADIGQSVYGVRGFVYLRGEATPQAGR